MSFINRLIHSLIVAVIAVGFTFADESKPRPQSVTEGEEPAAAVASSAPMLFERLTIIGGEEKTKEVPGSAHYVAAEELARQDHSDVGRVLRQIPGVNVQDEEGFGLRPNVGMRGTGVERSQKITLLEDGILIAPAPYSAPAAYYFPTVGRMEAIEIRKGSSSIRQGPYTTGGVLNLISTSIPYDFGGTLDAAAGTDATGRVHALAGDSSERYGWLLETYQLRTDGFKRLDSGGDTGFELSDYVGKFRFNSSSNDRIQQALELKIGKTGQEGDETYLGLTDVDFQADPFRRYAASQVDRIETDHEQAQLRHFLQASSSIDVTTTIYRNDFFRNWFKLDNVGGTSIASILANPAAHASSLAILRGEADATNGALRVRNNRRNYYSHGIQSVAASRFRLAAMDHEIELGIRYHEDEEDRFQEDDRFNMIAGTMSLFAAGASGSNANRIGSAKAVAFFLQDEIRVGRLSLTPGLRYESIDYTQKDFGRNDPARTGSSLALRENAVDVVIPGLGATFEINPSFSVFAGAHKGFSPPGPGSDHRTRAEESVNYEAGARYAMRSGRFQLVGFFNDYSNLLGRDTLSSGGGGTGDLFNGGEVEVKGLEALAESSLENYFTTSLRIPVRVSYTYTSAVFQSSFETSFEDWAPRVVEGDRLPYIPEHQWSASAGVANDRWSSYLTLTHSDGMRTSAGQGPIQANQRTDDFLTADLSIDYRLLPAVRVFTQVRNLSDETYIVARRPAGVRPGVPRSVLIGFDWDF